MPDPNTPFNPYAIWETAPRHTSNDPFAVGAALTSGWNTLFSNNYWPLVGGTLLIGLMSFVVSFLPFGLSFIGSIFLAPASLGITFAFVRAFRGQPVTIAHAFGGFSHYWPLVLLNLIMLAIGIAVAIPVMLIVGLGVMIFGSTQVPMELAVPVSIVLGLVITVVYFYLVTRISFAALIIMDEHPGTVGPIDALKTSWAITADDALPIMGLLIILAMINVIGFILLVLPTIFITGPLALAATAAAYCMITRRLRAQHVGFCVYCGYDLRTLKGSARCPECGGPVSST